MSSDTQTTLYDFHDPAEFAPKQFVKTVILHLKPPTDRKQERLETAIAEAHRITTTAADRMPSVPRKRWGVAKPKNSTWYNWAKEIDHCLSNKTAHENIQRVREAFRSWQSQGYDGDRPQFEAADRCSFYYGQPKYKIYNDQYYVSLPLAAGRGERELLPIRDGAYIRAFVDGIQGEEFTKGRGELLRRDGGYDFHQVIRTDVEILQNPTTAVGVDIGLTNLAAAGAVANDVKQGATLWSGTQAAEMRNRFAERKRHAQSDAEYEQLRNEEHRYIEHICHTISRELIEWALNHDRPAIIMEDLTDIRETFIQRKREHTPNERRALHSWPFRKLQDMIAYKATESGLPVEYVDPAHTSTICNECGHRDKANREGVHFECSNCGYQVNADVNAAFNIALV